MKMCKQHLIPSLLACLFLSACAENALPPSPLSGEEAGGRLVMEMVESDSLANNLVGDPGHRNVIVYLPPSYDQEAGRYPVVYFLHGYDDTNTVWRDGKFYGFRLPESVDELVETGAIREMILVFPDARNFFSGSFYTNSPVTGNWEDFISRDLITYIDGHYRTVADPAARGITGHSMGGYGAIYLAARHPDIFSCVWGISSATLAMVGDVTLEPEWKKTLAVTRVDQIAEAGNYVRAYLALSAALSPNPGQGPFQADYPFRLEDGQLVPNPETYARWIKEFPADSMDLYEDGFRKLSAIAFDVGEEDQFSHIPAGSRLLSRRLTEKAIPHRFEVYDGTHWNRVGERLGTHVLPFFSEMLAR